MAETFKQLAAVNLSTTTMTDVLTLTSGQQAVAEVTLCNRTTSEVTVRMAHSGSGATLVVAHYKLYDFTLGPNETYFHDKSLKMGASDVLRVSCSAANALSVTIDGILIA